MTEAGERIPNELVKKLYYQANTAFKLAKSCALKHAEDSRIGSFLYKTYLELIDKNLGPDFIISNNIKKLVDGIFSWRYVP
jgi:hypothetical protein